MRIKLFIFYNKLELPRLLLYALLNHVHTCIGLSAGEKVQNDFSPCSSRRYSTKIILISDDTLQSRVLADDIDYYI